MNTWFIQCKLDCKERVSDCCLTPIEEIIQLYHGENKLYD